jgi:hypothetical protein
VYLLLQRRSLHAGPVGFKCTLVKHIAMPSWVYTTAAKACHAALVPWLSLQDTTLWPAILSQQVLH